jgi:hypothetical protein
VKQSGTKTVSYMAARSCCCKQEDAAVVGASAANMAQLTAKLHTARQYYATSCTEPTSKHKCC